MTKYHSNGTNQRKHWREWVKDNALLLKLAVDILVRAGMTYILDQQ